MIFEMDPVVSELEPTPLWFKVPQDVLHDVLTGPWCELSPDFLCFEQFYQAVAHTWPHEYRVFDIGGYIGVQGWLFDDFAYYADVNKPLMAERAVIPDGFDHIVADGCDFMDEYAREVGFGPHDLFICSAVPDKMVQEAVMVAPNHVCWYPGEEMDASGPFGQETKRLFERLRQSDWHRRADHAVWSVVCPEMAKRHA